VAAKVELELVGAATLEATLRHAMDELGDLDQAQAEAGRIIAGRAAADAPRLTGALAASVQAASEPGQAVISSDLPYAAVQNYGYPPHHIRATLFLTNAGTDTETQWLPRYDEQVQQIVDGVRGA
jgi:phage gpG-like protein